MAELSIAKEGYAQSKFESEMMKVTQEAANVEALKISKVVANLKRQDEVVENETFQAMLDRAKAGLKNVTSRRKESAEAVEQASKAFEAATDQARNDFYAVSIKATRLNAELDQIERGHMAMLSTVHNEPNIDPVTENPSEIIKKGK